MGTKRTAFSKVVISCGFVLLATAVLTSAPRKTGFSELPNGRGGTNVEAFVVPEGFNKAKSLAAFKETLYPVLRANCSGCHSTENKLGSGAQAPLHADVNVNLAHEYALTRVNFREPAESKFVVRMAIDRHNCFAENCGVAAKQMLAAVNAWRDRVSDMVPPVDGYTLQSNTQPRITQGRLKLTVMAKFCRGVNSVDAPFANPGRPQRDAPTFPLHKDATQTDSLR